MANPKFRSISGPGRADFKNASAVFARQVAEAPDIRSSSFEPAAVDPFLSSAVDIVDDSPEGQFWARGYGWTTKRFTTLKELRDALGQRTASGETPPAVVYFKHCPWTGVELHPVKTAGMYVYRGPFWTSQLFKSEENARHWFSIRNGKKPIFGPDVVVGLTKALEMQEPDREVGRDQMQAIANEAAEEAGIQYDKSMKDKSKP